MLCFMSNTYSRYVFNMNKYINDATVEEILPCIYSGETFNGYDNVNLPFHRLSDIFAGKILPTYYEALKKITGVYCLTDTNTGKLYIGSATGSEGVAQRWGNYLDSKHGGNKKLIELYKKEGAEYFEKYFTYTFSIFSPFEFVVEVILLIGSILVISIICGTYIYKINLEINDLFNQTLSKGRLFLLNKLD